MLCLGYSNLLELNDIFITTEVHVYIVNNRQNH